MTHEEQSLLEAHLDGTVEVTLANGDQRLIRPIILVDEPPTPDLFFVSLDSDGNPVGTAGESILLADIVSVRLPG